MARISASLVFGFATFAVLTYSIMIWYPYTEAVVGRQSSGKPSYRLIAQSVIDRYTALHKNRTDYVKAQCDRHRKELPKMEKTPILLVNEKYKLVYCQTPKAGTDSWCKLFLVLSGYKSYTEVLKMNVMNVSAAWKKHVPKLSQFTPAKQRYILSNYTKIMIVRNPLTRLLSAFNDKAVAKNKSDYNLSFQRQLSKQILQDFRTGNVSGQYDPTFNEFIRMIVSTESINNIHWRNMHQICFPCDIKYDIIGRFEHIEDDSNYILRLVGSDIRFPKSTGTHFTNSSHRAKIKQGYAKIPRSDMKSIYRKYKLDFLLFGYEQEIP
ncbi:carbohydrate sulfotransferase 11-like [Antedon mediterranea]|uniref:carbohydrate sulfotransferase 11-like n=1 Tax=Antedon mediterranea TaxID=105859 RepID=UPI003AF6EA5F